MRRHRLLYVTILSGLGLLSALILPALYGADAARRLPVNVTFGPNINLSVQRWSPKVPQRETTIAANPGNPLNLVAGAIDSVPRQNDRSCSFSFTLDGGQTWKLGGGVPLEASGDTSGDPALAADADGNFYYSYLRQDKTLRRFDVLVAKSTDGGRTFPTFSVVARTVLSPTSDSLNDKDFIGVDTGPASPSRGAIYVTWTELFGDATADFYRINVATSRDGGVTWSAPQHISPSVSPSSEWVMGSVPVVAPDGTAYVFWSDIILHTGPFTIIFSKSTDGGRTWSPAAQVAAGVGPGLYALRNADPNYGVDPSVGIHANGWPTAAVAADGTAFVAWTDVRNGSCHDIGGSFLPCTDSDVMLSSSADGGRTWTTPRKVGDDATATDQFFPWIATHPNGLLSLAWQDKRLDPNNVNFDTFYTNTFDGALFLPNVRVTTASSLPGVGQTSIQDYNGLAATADGVFPIWSDMRSGDADIYSSAGRLVP